MASFLLTVFAAFNCLSPKDRTSHKVAAGVGYGPSGRQTLDIYAPGGQGGPWPVVFFCYGGSWTDGDRRNYAFAGRALAALGYVTVIADHRLVPEVEYPVFLCDCAEAFAWVAENISGYGGDATRIALMGHSAGAYNAAMLALDPAYLAARGLMDRVRCFVGLSGPYDIFPFDGPISIRVFGAVPNPKSTQPVTLATKNAPPSFLGHGTADTLVFPRNSEILAKRLRQAGVPVVEKYYAGLGHPQPLLVLGTVLRKRAPVLADVAAFLKEHLDGDGRTRPFT
jgi:acetyl esterase/lipase